MKDKKKGRKGSRCLWILGLLLLIASPAFALLDDNSTNYDQKQKQQLRNENDLSQSLRNENDNRNENSLRNENDLSNRNDQDQRQGQGQAQGQAQAAVAVQGQAQSSSNSNANEYSSNYKSTAYAFAPPGLTGGVGVEQANIYSIFGGVGSSQTADYSICIEKIKTIKMLEEAQYMTHDQAVIEATAVLSQLKTGSRPKRVLGVGGYTTGKNLLNAFGLLSWDSWQKEPGDK